MSALKLFTQFVSFYFSVKLLTLQWVAIKEERKMLCLLFIFATNRKTEVSVLNILNSSGHGLQQTGPSWPSHE